jgi:hypothetical protein
MLYRYYSGIRFFLPLRHKGTKFLGVCLPEG